MKGSPLKQYSVRYSFIPQKNSYWLIRTMSATHHTFLTAKENFISRLPTPLKMIRLTPMQKFTISSMISVWLTIEYLDRMV